MRITKWLFVTVVFAGCVDATSTPEPDPTVEARGNRCRAEAEVSIETPIYGDFTFGQLACCHSYQIDGVSLSHCVVCGGKWKCTSVE